ncbi:MAG: transposase [Anaerolineales bacterium]|nr:MAG: transposase [Anaerolineales bacterium]
MRRKQIRIPDFDYSSPGAYFITVCVQDRRNLLSQILDAEISLKPPGNVVLQTWMSLPVHYPYVEVDEFVVMPNHIHGLVWIRDMQVNRVDVGAGFKPAPTRHGLSEIARGFKTFSSRKINELPTQDSKFAWQRGFYEHVIRDEKDLYDHRLYIQENPVKWQNDEYYG